MNASFQSDRFAGTGMIVLTWLLFCSGCGPVYDTRYSFIPPTDPVGRSCIFQCENSRMQCNQIEELTKMNCEQRARQEQQACQWRMEMRGEKEHWYDCTAESCSTDTEQCDSMYRSCYESCGGRVEAQTVCVMNCGQPLAQPR